MCESLLGSATLGHDRTQWEQATEAQEEEAGESECKTSFLSKVSNRTTANKTVLMHIPGGPRATVMYHNTSVNVNVVDEA